MDFTILWKSLAILILLAKSSSSSKDDNIPHEKYSSDVDFFKPSKIDNENPSNGNTPFNTIYEMDNRASKPADEDIYQSNFSEKFKRRLTKRNPEGELIKMIRFYLKQKKGKAIAGDILKSMLQEYSE
ncbi:uncharacterized protein LOC143469616 isoform X2 [Clavelina lepadiformis]|uniref:uncharacterized protein LOC143469616 isoform X2 n=1 Tax=Clavelina lepadiformis TaxID=159417 RepID=UPI004041E873